MITIRLLAILFTTLAAAACAVRDKTPWGPLSQQVGKTLTKEKRT